MSVTDIMYYDCRPTWKLAAGMDRSLCVAASLAAAASKPDALPRLLTMDSKPFLTFSNCATVLGLDLRLPLSKPARAGKSDCVSGYLAKSLKLYWINALLEKVRTS